MANRPTQTSNRTVDAKRNRMQADAYHADTPVGEVCRQMVTTLSGAERSHEKGDTADVQLRLRALVRIAEGAPKLFERLELTDKSHISELGLSPSVAGWLERSGVCTIGDIEARGRMGLLVVFGISEEGVREIEGRLSVAGLNFWRFR